MHCPNCGAENPERAKFCLECGSPLTANVPATTPGAPEQEFRKTVTILFCDLVGSTSMGERLDPESLRSLMRRYFDTMREIIERHGGTIEKFIGDAVMAVFGVPVVHEDDAIRAVRTAAEMRTAAAILNDELRERWGAELHTRTGVYTGAVVAGVGDATLATGDAVNTAARFEQAAGTDEILIGEVTHRLTRDATEVASVPPLTLKGKSEPVPAYRLIEVREHAMGAARRMDLELVGRDEQLRVLGVTLERAIASGRPQLVTVAGDPGVGKSRLVGEVAARAGDRWVVLRGTCLPYGEGVGFWPLLEALQAGVQISPDDLPAVAVSKIAMLAGDVRTATGVAQLAGIVPAESPAQELFPAVRTMVERMAQRRPVLLVIDDLHWAAPAMLDLVEHLARWTEAPLVIAGTARREFIRDLRPDWGQGPDATTLELMPLAADDAERLIATRLGGDDVPHAVRERIVGTAEGNPLFVQEFIAMLIDDGSIVRDGDGWRATRDLSEIEVPPTISAILSARIERLDAPERADAERASVQGQSFSIEALRALSPDEVRATIDEHLAMLEHAELVEHDRPEEYRFRHILIRDTVYEGALKEVRADLHERFADWMVENRRAFDEIVGYHLDQAYRLRVELGPERERERTLAVRASSHLARSGRQALSLADMASATSLLTRAVDLLTIDDPARSRLLPELAEALLDAGDFEGARTALDAAAATAKTDADDHLAATVALTRTDLELYTQPEDWADRTASVVSDAMTAFERAADELGLARACGQLAFVHMYRCDAGSAAGWALRAAEHAERAGVYGGRHLATYASALLYGPMPAETAIASCEELLAREDLGAAVQAPALQTLGALRAMQGDFAEAARLIREGEVLDLQLGRELAATMATAELLAETALLAGDPSEADAHLGRAYDALVERGERAYASTLAAMRSRVLCDLGRYDEALAAGDMSREVSDEDDIVVQVIWRGGIGRALVHTGDPHEAVRVAREGVELAERTDHLTMHAAALLDLAEVLSETGLDDEAADRRDEARLQFERKGNRAAIAAMG